MGTLTALQTERRPDGLFAVDLYWYTALQRSGRFAGAEQVAAAGPERGIKEFTSETATKRCPKRHSAPKRAPHGHAGGGYHRPSPGVRKQAHTAPAASFPGLEHEEKQGREPPPSPSDAASDK